MEAFLESCSLNSPDVHCIGIGSKLIITVCLDIKLHDTLTSDQVPKSRSHAAEQ